MAAHTIENINLSSLLESVKRMKEQGFRLIQMSCTHKDTFILDYTFGKELDLFDLKIILQALIEVPSITSIFPAAFIYENEMHDLFGIHITEISIDYRGNLFKTSIKTPFGNQTAVATNTPEK